MWAMEGAVSGELLSFGGRVLVDPSREVLEWLLPAGGFRPVQVLGADVRELEERHGRPFVLLKDHPDYAGMEWPPRRSDFR